MRKLYAIVGLFAALLASRGTHADDTFARFITMAPNALQPFASIDWIPVVRGGVTYHYPATGFLTSAVGGLTSLTFIDGLTSSPNPVTTIGTAGLMPTTNNTVLGNVSGVLVAPYPLNQTELTTLANGLTPIANNTVLGNVSGIIALPGALNQAQLTALVNPFNITSFPGVDDTGATPSDVGIQAAITAACAETPVPYVFAPPGRYKFLNHVSILCSLQLGGTPGTATFFADSANVELGSQILYVAADNVGIGGLIFDGNVAGGNINDAELIQVQSPTDGFLFLNNQVKDAYADAIFAIGGTRVAGVLSIAAAVGQPDLTFAAVPAGVKPGSQPSASFLDPNLYATAVTATVVTLNQNMFDTGIAGRSIQFTPAFTTSANAFYGDLTLATADTSTLAVGQTIYSNTTPQCVQSKTRITAVTINVSVTIDRKIICNIPSGDLIAAALGNSSMTIANSSFKELGQPQIAGSVAPFNYTTVGIQASGQANLTLTCRSGPGCTRAGLVPGQKTAATGLPAGVPASTLVIGEAFSVDSPVGSYTITLAAPLTAAVPDATAIPFNVGRAARGYGIWYAFGSWFANRDSQFINNYFYHTWFAPIFLSTVGNVLLQGNNYVMDGMEFVDPVAAGSPCTAVGNVKGVKMVGERCHGSAQNGVEILHSTSISITGSEYTENGRTGIQICGGRDIAIGGGTVAKNNGQWKNRPYITNQDDLGQTTAGIKITGSCTFGQPGFQTNTTIDNVVLVDDQPTATQERGIGYRNTDSGFVNLRLGDSITGSGNVSELIDSQLLAFTGTNGTTGSIGGAALLAGVCASGTVAVLNVTTGMAVDVTPVTYPGDGIYWKGYVSAPGTVTVSVCAAVAATPTASVYNVRVIR